MTGKDLKNKLELTGMPFRQIAEALGISEQNLQNKMSSADIKVSFLCKISKVLHKSVYFLLEGQDYYIEDSENRIASIPSVTPNSQVQESIIYKQLYKEKDEENKILIEEIGSLKERIRQLESLSQDTAHYSKVDEVIEAFTSESSGDYGESSLPTKQSTISKRLSAGKI